MVNPNNRHSGGRFSGRDRGRETFKRRSDTRNEPRNDKPKIEADDKDVKDPKVKKEEPVVEGEFPVAAAAGVSSPEEKKFTGRCRLFVGNIAPDTEENAFGELFKPYGEFSEIFLNASRGFGFIRMDTKENADKAKKGLDGIPHKGRTLRVRFAAHTGAVRVKYLHPFVSNELLEEAFSIFGEIERSIVCIDEKGKPNGEGIVFFARKPGALQAVKRVSEGVFLLGSSPRPVTCEMLEHRDEDDGLPEAVLPKNAQDYQKEREAPPRFASQGSFEFNFSLKWKELYSQNEHRKKQLKLEFEDAVSKLEMDEANAQMEYQTQMMREDLMRRQEELRRMEEQHQVEMQKRMEQRRQQEEAKRNMDEERRREDEARMFMQQELAMRQMQEEHHRGPQNQGGPGNAPPMQPPPAPPAGLAGPGGNRGRQNEMGMRNQGMSPQMHQGMSPMQGGPQGNQNMRGGRKSDSDYRQSRFDQPPHQSRFDQPPLHFQGNQQQQMGSGPGGPHGGNMMFGGPGGPGNMGGPGNRGNQGNMGPGGPQGNMGPGGPQGNMGPGSQQGNMGPGGQQGNMGPGGQQGNRGPGGQGNMGPGGQQGNMGPGGQQGNRGPGGQQGNVGPGGQQGNMGPGGQQGNRGPGGQQGNRGPGGPGNMGNGPNGPPQGQGPQDGQRNMIRGGNKMQQETQEGASGNDFIESKRSRRF